MQLLERLLNTNAVPMQSFKPSIPPNFTRNLRRLASGTRLGLKRNWIHAFVSINNDGFSEPEVHNCFALQGHIAMSFRNHWISRDCNSCLVMQLLTSCFWRQRRSTCRTPYPPKLMFMKTLAMAKTLSWTVTSWMPFQTIPRSPSRTIKATQF